MKGIYFKQVPVGPMENFCYLVGAEGSPETAAIDPAWDVPALLDALAQDGRRLTHALFTHHHFDHTGGLPEVLAGGARAYLAASDVPYLRVDAPPSELAPVSGGDRIAVGPLEIEALATPGHTPGSTCYRVTSADESALVTGDTLFIGGCGRCDLPGGDADELWRTLRRLSALAPSTIIWPGHDYGATPSATLESERVANPYLARLESEAAFVQYRMRPRT